MPWTVVESVFVRAIPCRRLDAYVPGSKRTRDEAPTGGGGGNSMVLAYMAFATESAATLAFERLARAADTRGWVLARWLHGEEAAPRGLGKGGRVRGRGVGEEDTGDRE